MAEKTDINELIENSKNGDKNAELSHELLMYYTLFGNVNGGGHCCTVSDEPEFIEVTGGLLKLFCMDKDEFERTTFNSPKMMIYEPDRKWAHETIHSQLVVGDRSEVTYRILDGNGRIKWVHDVGNRMRRADGSEVIFSTLTDITEQVEANERLNNTSFELETLMSNIPGGICVFEYDGNRMNMSYANDEYFSLNGFTSEYFYMVGDMDISRFMSENDYEILREKLEASLSTSEPFDYEYKVIRNDDIEIWVALRARVFKYHGDNPVFYSVIWDISKRKQIEKELFLQSERYKAIEENMDEVPFDYVISTDTLTFSTKAEKIREDIDQKIYNFLGLIEKTDFIHPDSRENFIKFMAECRKKKCSGTFEFQAMFRADMQYHWYEMHYTNVLDSNGVPVRIVGRVNDFDEEKKAQEEVQMRLMCDEMTGLYNKSACESIISEKIKKSETKGALLVVDIDNFKLINDTFGHTFGDTVIQNFAQGIKTAVWDDVVVGRIGGDEFLLYVPDSEQDDAVEIAKHICELVKKSYVGEQLHLPEGVGCSIGIAYTPDDGNEYHTVFDKADLAMYQSKAMGKNRYTVYDKSIEASKVNLALSQSERNEGAIHSHTLVYDADFITFAFSLLSHSRDINSSINILLERIGMNYNADYVALLEDIADDGYMHHTNLWASDKGIMAEETLPPLNAKATRYIPPKSTAPNFYVINDVSNMKTDADVGEFLHQTYNCFALSAMRFPENNSVDGALIITDCTNTRDWTEMELGTFSELSRLMSVFVSLRRERIKSSEKIEELSTIDALTGLYNQPTFIAQADSFIKEHITTKCVALIYTDINGFSYVNENFGYEAGDKMLCDFADTISTDTAHPKINGRIYSDFFLTISAADSEDEIVSSVDNLSNYFLGQQKAIYPASNLSLSTGIFFIREIPKHSISTLIENANLARKESKVVGESYYIYDDQLSKKRSREQRAANDLHNAIETGELRLFLQPKFSIQNRVSIGAEALVRWILPDGTLRYPDEFIPILEQIGYIMELDYFIFAQTLKFIRKWLDEDRVVHPISVNFARQHLKTDDFVQRVYSLTQEYKVPPEYVEIEITESESVNDSEHFLSVMEQFHSLGFRIDIDDFGTGYSSLSMLLDAPFDVVKIDKRFITNVEYTPRYLSYLRTLIKLIQTSGKGIIFEGVETEQQAYYLSQCGCDSAQGFLFSRPICVEEYERKYVK